MTSKECLIPAPPSSPMPGYVPAPWLKRPEPIAPLPEQFRGNTKARILWERLFLSPDDAERPRWPSPVEWQSFPQIVEMVSELDDLDRRLAQEPDAARRDALTEEILDIDAEIQALVNGAGFPKRWLSNIVSARTRLCPRPEPRNGETVEEYDGRLGEWRRHRAATS